ncbi:MAG: T9SS type A sorting domain-containing protein [Saprospiraceae bacterium]|nr:T9SS type A sorting domain-containing protein [Saprospiraceae bacterium]MCB9325564.1 T9SS type A sorting domain-containing protein [Lewinellaceae bacterium]
MFTHKNTLLFALILSVFSAFGQTDKEYFQDMVDAEREAHASLMNYRFNELTTDYDIKYHRFDWEVDPAVYYIKGSVETIFEAKENNFATLHFDLSTGMQVDSVIYYGQSLTFSQTNPDLLVINLSETLNAGDQRTIKVYYQGQPSGSGFGSFAQGTHANYPMIWTLSEPYGAKDWWPAKQDLNDKIDSIDVYVKTPMPNRVASNGLLVDSVQTGNSMIYHWKHRYPIPAYLIAIAVTNYSVYDFYVETDDEPILVSNYTYPEDLEWAQLMLEWFPPIMQLYNEKFIKYPFADEKYGHAKFGWGGGMEHTTMTFMGGWSPYLQAHELAHQWFGDMVTCGSWEDIWLNEGFATYLEGMTQEHGLGENTWMNWKQQRIDQVTAQPGGSVRVDDTTSVNRIFDGRLSYSKGALLLHMLRWKLGDEDFFQALRNYLTDPGNAYGYAKTPELIAHMEAQSGQDLTEFFADWYYGQGYPDYQIDWSQNSENVLKVEIYQTPSHESVEFFEMPVPIQFSGQGNTVTLTFDNMINGQSFYVPMDFEIESAQFDPERWLCATSSMTVGTPEILLRENTLSLFPNPAKNEVEIEIKNNALQMQLIQVFDHSGKMVLSKDGGNLVKTDLDISNLPAGNYAVKVTTKKGIGVLRLTRI